MPRERRGAGYTIGFAAAVCLVCAVAVSGLAVALAPRQEANRELDRQRNVLIAAGLAEPGAADDAVRELFAARVKPATTDGGRDLYEVRGAGGELEMVVLPVSGPGLWSTLYGFLAIDADGTTVRGIAFYEHGETPGLGGEVDNPGWRARWPGRRAFDRAGRPALRVIKGRAGEPADDPHQVDGLSGATMTSAGVSQLVQEALGDDAYGPYLAQLRRAGGGR